MSCHLTWQKGSHRRNGRLQSQDTKWCDNKSNISAWFRFINVVILSMPLWKKKITKQLGKTARWIWRLQGGWRRRIHLRRIRWIRDETEEAVLRWQRNKTGRPLSPPQIHQKNIWMLSKFHKTTSESWQRTSGTQKSSPLSSKGGRKNIKEKTRDKRGRDRAPSWEGSLKNREVSKHQATLSLLSLWWTLEAQREI